MRAIEIESWALRVLENVTAARPSEDDLVELKSTWLPANKLARRLAAHANSARSDFILWLIGVDEKSQTVCGADAEELANWWPQMQAEFADRIAPDLIALNIAWKGKTVVALLFKADRIPYVVRNPAFSVEKGESVAWEVPWRGSNATRTATRNELITLLAPLHTMPLCEIRAAELSAYKPFREDNQMRQRFELFMDFYVFPQDEAHLYIPRDRCIISVGHSEELQAIESDKFAFRSNSEGIVEHGKQAVAITRPCGFGFEASGSNPPLLPEQEDDLYVEVELQPIGFDKNIVLSAVLHPVAKKPTAQEGYPLKWTFNDLRVASKPQRTRVIGSRSIQTF